ncbi:MAG: hypothetical protein AAGF23_02165 [Acidobacteriota bacterium]
MNLAELDLPAGEVLDGEGVVAQDVVENAGGGEELGGKQLVGAEDRLVVAAVGRDVFGDADPHHGAPGAEVLGERRGGEIGFVVRRDGHEEVALVDGGALQNRHLGAVAEHDGGVDFLLHALLLGGVALDDDDVVAVRGKRAGQVESDLTGAHDDEALLLERRRVRRSVGEIASHKTILSPPGTSGGGIRAHIGEFR